MLGVLLPTILHALVVDDFGVKYVGEEHAKHLLSILLKIMKECMNIGKAQIFPE